MTMGTAQAIISLFRQQRSLGTRSCRVIIRSHSSINGGSTVAETMSQWTEAFLKDDIPEPEDSVRHILASVIGGPWHSVSREGSNLLTPLQMKEMERKCICRLQRMPVQYIVGDWDFCDVTVRVRPPVFIPRPETEQLACLAAERLLGMTGVRRPQLLEIGCGSGALSVSILHRVEQAFGTAVDMSAAACELTRENSRRCGVADRLHVALSRLTASGFSEQLQRPDGGFQLVVTNPPYVPRGHLRQLAPEIMLYEDVVALDGGDDGLSVVRHVLQHAVDWLAPEGRLLMEVGSEHPRPILELLQNTYTSLQYLHTHRDFAGLNRFVEIGVRAV